MTALRYITESPPNASTPLPALDGSPLGDDLTYQRNNFDIPDETPTRVDLSIAGVSGVLEVSDIQALERREIDMVLECAGNGRILMSPVPEGTPWDLGGASPVLFSGPPLLDCLGPVPESEDLLIFTGADRGEVEPEGVINYQFSLERALWDRSILATHLGGEPLSKRHGGPVRLVVPGQYGMKSVKWVEKIQSASGSFGGHFVNKYRYHGDREEPDSAPVGEIRVRSIISSPQDGYITESDEVEIVGSAWSGGGTIEVVEVSLDEGPWQPATLEHRSSPFSATHWRIVVGLAPGNHSARARARDTTGNVQPIDPQWNENGYGNNMVHRIDFSVSSPSR